MVPFRAVVESLLNGVVSWDTATRTVIATVNGHVVSFALDDLTIPVIVVENRAFVPISFIMDNLMAN
jgi:ubiquinone biosynthesis protein UbiJ